MENSIIEAPQKNVEDINRLNRSITSSGIEIAKKKRPGHERFTAEFYQSLKN
jgi:hypothetical protein